MFTILVVETISKINSIIFIQTIINQLDGFNSIITSILNQFIILIQILIDFMISIQIDNLITTSMKVIQIIIKSIYDSLIG